MKSILLQTAKRVKDALNLQGEIWALLVDSSFLVVCFLLLGFAARVGLTLFKVGYEAAKKVGF